MDDPEVQETVESILGKNVKVIDCEKKSTIQEEEVLLINGLPVTLEGRDGRAIKQALLTGQVPPCDLLNTLLIRTGILRAPVKLETSLSVKTSTVTKEEVTVARDGKIVDERSREVKENNFYTSSSSEVWEPIGIIPSSDVGKYVNNVPHQRPEVKRCNSPLATGERKAKENYYTSSSNEVWEPIIPVSMHQRADIKRCDSPHTGYETGSERKSCSSSSSNSSDGLGLRRLSSKDSGHLTNSSFIEHTQSSGESLNSFDETDFKNDLLHNFRKCGLKTNGYKKDISDVSNFFSLRYYKS